MERGRRSADDSAPDPLYRALVEGVSDAVFVADHGGGFVFVNERACELLGYARDELFDRSISDVVASESIAESPLKLDALVPGRGLQTDRMLLRKDGTRVYVQLRAERMVDGRIFAFVRDIGASIDAVRAFAETEPLLREVGTNVPSLVWVRAAGTGALLYANPRWARFVGVEPVLGEHFSQLFVAVHPDDLARVAAGVAAAPEGGFDDVVRLQDELGRARWLHLRTFAVRDETGAVTRVAGVAEDVTERRTAMEAMRASETKYRNLFENAPVGIFRSGLGDEGFLDVNRKLCELLEGTRDEILGRPPSEVWVDPEQRAEMLRELLATGATQIHARIRTLRGNVCEVLMAGVLYREHGYLEGTVIDLTEHRRAERALAEGEARYRSVVESMHDGILVMGSDGAILSTNPAADRMFATLGVAFARAESRLGTWAAVREDGTPFPPGESPPQVTLRTGEPQTRVVMGVQTPDGMLRWLSVSTRLIGPFDPSSERQVVASFTDITDPRRAEERLRASLREKEVLLREIHHRVKNNLQLVSSMLYLQASRSGDARLQQLLRESQNRVASMALLHRRLYESPDLAEIPFERYVRELARSLYESYGVSSTRVDLKVSTSGIVLHIETALPCGLILNELLSNALKHAYPGEAHGVIVVEIATEGAQHRLAICDDGVGLPPDFDARSRSSLGTKLVERLVAQIGGTLERSTSDQGTAYVIRFPRDATG